MQIGGLPPIMTSAAGTSLAQSKGTDTQQTQGEVRAQQRGVESSQRAANAAGIAATDGEDNQAEDRDADGRRMWEFEGDQQPAQAADGEAQAASETRVVKDPTGESGGQLDLSG